MKKLVLSAIMLLGLQLAIMGMTSVSAMYGDDDYAQSNDDDEYAWPDDEGYYDE